MRVMRAIGIRIDRGGLCLFCSLSTHSSVQTACASFSFPSALGTTVGGEDRVRDAMAWDEMRRGKGSFSPFGLFPLLFFYNPLFAYITPTYFLSPFLFKQSGMDQCVGSKGGQIVMTITFLLRML